MSARLVLASLWLPPWIARRELERVEKATGEALARLLTAADVAAPAAETPSGPRDVAARRRAMAVRHTAMIAQLVAARGRDAAISEARAALYVEGVRLGGEARARLGMRATRRDLLRAAHILYRVLGIDFRAAWTPDETACVEIGRCALSRAYSPDACHALSATDAGVVAGLWPGARLEFSERMTEGRPSCIARLTLPKTAGEEGA